MPESRTYVELLESVVLALLTERESRGANADLEVVGYTPGGRPAFFSPPEVRRRISESRARRGLA